MECPFRDGQPNSRIGVNYDQPINAVNISSAGLVRYDGGQGLLLVSTVTQHAVLLGGSSNGYHFSLHLTILGKLAIRKYGSRPFGGNVDTWHRCQHYKCSWDRLLFLLRLAVGFDLDGCHWDDSGQQLVNNGYIANNAGLVTVHLASDFLLWAMLLR